MTKRRDLVREMERAGFRLERSRGGHDVYSNGTKSVPVPRHREIPDRTAEMIRKEAGLR